MEKKDIEKRINELQSMLDSFKNELRKKVNPKFEVGKWYKCTKYGYLYYPVKFAKRIFDTDYFNVYGIDSQGYWVNIDDAPRHFNHSVPATDKEVEEALIKEAERRYSKAKGYITNGSSWIVNEFHRYEYKEGALKLWADITFVETGNRYESGYNEVFINGKWAEIIKDEPIKVGGYEVKRIGKGYNCMFEIGCKKVSYSELKTIKALMEENKFKTISFDKVEVSLETINKIIKGDFFN